MVERAEVVKSFFDKEKRASSSKEESSTKREVRRAGSGGGGGEVLRVDGVVDSKILLQASRSYDLGGYYDGSVWDFVIASFPLPPAATAPDLKG